MFTQYHQSSEQESLIGQKFFIEQPPFIKQEPFVKQEYDISDIPDYRYPPVDSSSQVVGLFSSSPSVPTMSHQSSSQSYSSFSTQDSSGVYDQNTEQWIDFENHEQYATSPVQDSYIVSVQDGSLFPVQEDYLPSSMPTDYNEHAYLNDGIQNTPLYQQAPVQIPGQNSNTSGKGDIWQCLYCESHFTRCADLNRHYNTVHNPDALKFDCPKKKCTRVKEHGFTRKDHLKEHLRQYHKDLTIPKRKSK